MRERSRWIVITVLVAILVSAGVTLIAFSGAGDVSRDLGVSITSGGITGIVFILAQSILAEHDDRKRLLSDLSISQDLTGVSLSKRKIDGVALVGKPMAVADLSHASLRFSKFVGADLQWSTLRNSDFTASIFAHANLDETDLRDAVFRRANLRNATFRNARLHGAILESADLSGADLRDAHLEGADLAHIAYDGRTRWPPGVTPPKSDPSAFEHHRLEPDWDDYWFKHGHVGVRHASTYDDIAGTLSVEEQSTPSYPRSRFDGLKHRLRSRW